MISENKPKHLIYDRNLVMRSLAFVALMFVSSTVWSRPVFISFNYSGTFKCGSNEVVSGVRYDDRGNKSLLGIWCSKAPKDDLQQDFYLAINDGGNGRYDVNCPGQHMVLGFDFSLDFDPSAEAMYCSYSEAKSGRSQYMKVEGLRGKRYDVMCRQGSFVSGVKFREGLDDTVIGIFCTEFQP